MKKRRNHQSNETDTAAEYDFSGGERGKYAKRNAHGTNVVVLEPDVAKLFPDSKTVNRSLRGLATIIRIQRKNAGASVESATRLAGAVRRPKNLSSRKGFSTK